MYAWVEPGAFGSSLLNVVSSLELAPSSVVVRPGQTQLARMFRSEYSTAIDLVNWRTPPFDVS